MEHRRRRTTDAQPAALIAGTPAVIETRFSSVCRNTLLTQRHISCAYLNTLFLFHRLAPSDLCNPMHTQGAEGWLEGVVFEASLIADRDKQEALAIFKKVCVCVYACVCVCVCVCVCAYPDISAHVFLFFQFWISMCIHLFTGVCANTLYACVCSLTDDQETQTADTYSCDVR
jgi:hypothetical protein